MEPGIGRSIAQGFRATHRSWSGLAFFLVVNAIVTAVGFGVMALTGMPQELFDPTVVEAEKDRLANEWIAGAWPALSVAWIVSMAVSIWLFGGQIGYLISRIKTQQAKLSEFWTIGRRAFWPLVGAGLLATVGLTVAMIVLAVLVPLVAAIPGLPTWVRGVIAAVIGAGLLGGLVWLGPRILFWFVAIVGDQLGPVGGLKASFRASRGRWWRIFGFLVLMLLIGMIVPVVLGVSQAIGIAVGKAAAASPLGFFASPWWPLFLLVPVQTYLSFVFVASTIHFYEEAKRA